MLESVRLDGEKLRGYLRTDVIPHDDEFRVVTIRCGGVEITGTPSEIVTWGYAWIHDIQQVSLRLHEVVAKNREYDDDWYLSNTRIVKI